MRLTRKATVILTMTIGLLLASCAAQSAQSGAETPAPTATVPAELAQFPHADTLPSWDEAPPLPQSVKDKAAGLLAERLGVDVKEIVYVEYKALAWNDASIGCARPGYAYAQVITPGYTIAFRDQSSALHFVNANHDGSLLAYCS